MIRPRLILALALAAWIVNALILWLGAAPLGHDESQYAIAAKDWLAGDPPRWFYLSTGMNYVAAFGNLAGGGELAMRLPAFLFGVAFIFAVVRLARMLFDEITAAWAVAVLAGAAQTVKWSSELLSDMPAATCMLAGMIVLVGELGRADDRPRLRLVLVAPAFAAAFYLRYASCVPIAVIVVAALVLYWRAVLRRPVVVLATAALFGLALVPHALAAIAITDSPLGILLESKSVPGQSGFAHGLVTYVTSNPFTFYGLAMPPVLIAGLVALRRDRGTALLWIVAVADIIAMGIITEAQARYVLIGTTLLVILGVHFIRARIASRHVVVRIAAAAVVATWLITVVFLVRNPGRRHTAMRATLVAAAAIRADARPGRCYLWGQHYTQLEVYTPCFGGAFSAWEALPRHEAIYVVRDHTPGWQPEPTDMPGRRTVILEIPDLVSVARHDPE
jgi:hypothetical protein